MGRKLHSKIKSEKKKKISLLERTDGREVSRLFQKEIKKLKKNTNGHIFEQRLEGRSSNWKALPKKQSLPLYLHYKQKP